jgi:hypothetical protein
MAIEYVAVPTGQDVADFLGAGSDTALVARCNETLLVIKPLARRHTRGNGWESSTVAAEIAAVIVAATARLAANPEQIDTQVGTVSVRGGFRGWSLVERMVLDDFRGTAQ